MKKAVIIAWFLALTFMIPVSATASEWWKDESLKGKLKLSEGQVNKIDSIVDTANKKRLETLKALRTKMRELNELLSKESFDRKKAEKMLDEVTKLRSTLLKINLTMKLNARNVLSKEQLKTLLKERPRVFTLRSRWAKRRTFKIPKVKKSLTKPSNKEKEK